MDPWGRADARRDRTAARRVGAPGHPGPAGSGRAGPPDSEREPAGLTSRGRAGKPPPRRPTSPRPSPAGQSGCQGREQRGAVQEGPHPTASPGTQSSERGGSAGPGGPQGKGSPPPNKAGAAGSRRARAAPSRQVARVPASGRRVSPLSGPRSCGEPPPGAQAQTRAVPAPRAPSFPRSFPGSLGPSWTPRWALRPAPARLWRGSIWILLTPSSSVSLVPGFLPKPEQVSGWFS